MDPSCARKRIVVVEDEEDVARLIRHGLERTGEFEVTLVTSGDAAVRHLAGAPPDLVILDLNLPVIDGVEVFRIIRSLGSTAHVPVIMLTARASENDRVAGLDLGADDYIVKPFSLRELAARTRAVIRRSQTARADDPRPLVYRSPHLLVDFEAVLVRVDGESIRVTRREFELLRYLIANRNRVLSREQLLERVWGYERDIETRSVDVHIGRLRKKLRTAGRQIETLIGLGYRFVDDPPVEFTDS
ncbi:MAG TPA: response regulator transcription factor [Vicinamibacterales bacterium]|nr:response regulator transcription factor [Vicinamibacterales bacterium]